MPIFSTSKEGRDRYAEIQLAMYFENLRNAEIQLSKDVLQEIQKLRNSGVSPENIVKSFMDKIDKGEGFEKHFLNNSAYELWKDMKAITQHEVYKSMDDGDYYRWEYNPSAKHCEICEELNGQIKTFQEWEMEGLPGHRNEGCYANCCCDLVEVKGKGKQQQRESNKILSQKDYSHTDNPQRKTHIIPLNINTVFIKLLQDKFKETEFLEINCLPAGLQEELYKVFVNMQNKLGDNFSNDLGRVSVQKLPPGVQRSNAIYQYDKKNYGGGAIKINIEKYGLDVEVKQEYLTQFNGTVIHEIAHHLAQIHNLEKRIKEFFVKNNTYIYDYYPRKDWIHIGNKDEFFAFSSVKFHNGTLNKEFKGKNNKIYDFIQGIYEELEEK